MITAEYRFHTAGRDGLEIIARITSTRDDCEPQLWKVELIVDDKIVRVSTRWAMSGMFAASEVVEDYLEIHGLPTGYSVSC